MREFTDQEIVRREKAAKIKELGLDPHKPLVVIVMGSLGSQSVNKVMKEALKKLLGKDYQVLYVTGKNNYDEFIKLDIIL